MDKRNIRSRKNIEEALIRLLESHSFEDISVAMIVQESGYSRSAFYANYQNRDDCLKAILDRLAASATNCHVTAALIGQENTDFEEPLRNYNNFIQHYTSMFESVYANKAVYRCLINRLHDDWTEYFKKKVVELSCETFDLCLENTIFHGKTVDVEMYHYTAISDLLGYVEYWFRHDLQYSPEFMAQQRYFKKIGLSSWVAIRKNPNV